MHRTLSVGALLFLSVNALAQNSTLGSVKGTVVDDSTRLPLEFVDVLLLRTADSTLITGAVTQSSGRFDLKDIPFGQYVVKFTLVGYREKTTQVFMIGARRRHLNLETIPLVSSAVALEPVTVSAEKALFDYSIDRKVYNVDQDIMSRTGSAADLLENIPSVSIDVNGGVILRGSSNVLVMINGRTSPLLDKRSATFLEQLPASSIERIEVITNPSAKYKAEGKAGIINIVLKKNTPLGAHGNLAVNAGNDGRYNGHVRLNYNPGGVNVFGSYTIRRITRNIVNSDSREELSTTDPAAPVAAYYSDDLFSIASPLSHLATLGFDYRADDNNSIGVSGTYFHDAFSRTDSSRRFLQDSTFVPLDRYDRNSASDELEEEYGLTGYLQHAFSTANQKLKLEATISRSPKDENNHFTNNYFIPALPTTFDNAYVDENDRRTQLTADYSNPLTAGSLFEAGYAGEISSSALDFYAEFYAPRQHRFVEDPRKTSQYVLHETINALYVSYKNSIGRLGVLAGVRAENDSRTSDLTTVDSSVARSFFTVFPTLHVSYKITPTATVQLSYSRRTSRPRARDLDPFPEYRDPRNTFLGHPDLLPEDVHSAELGCQLESDAVSLLPSLFYRYSTNSLTSIKRVVNRTTLLTDRLNLAHDRSAGVEMILSLNAGDLLTTHLSASGFFSEIDASNLGFIGSKSTRSWSGTWTTHVSVTRSLKVQLNARVSSVRLTPQGEYSPSSVVNVGLRQDLLEDRLSLVASVADVFRTLRRHFELDIPGLHQTVLNSRESHFAYVGFTYRLGTEPQKSREEDWHYDDEEDNR